MRFLFLFFSFTIIVVKVNSQPGSGLKKLAGKTRLEVGDIVPDMLLENIINYTSTKLKLSDFKGKPVILDFWNHGCIPCLEAFPELDSLQKMFQGKVQIILVNRESKDSTKRFFVKHKKIIMPSVPLVTGDVKLRKLFPKEGYPYTVWIDKNRVLRYISGGYNTTAKNITAFIGGKKLSMKDPSLKLKSGPAFTSPSENWAEEFKYFSYISRCRDGLYVGNSEREKINGGEAIRVARHCSSVIDLYKQAYREYDKYNFSYKYNLVLELKDSFRYVYPADHSRIDFWKDNYSFNYDLFLPASRTDERYKIMQQDLSRYFDLDATVVKKKVNSLVLVRISSLDKLKTKGGTPENGLDRIYDYIKGISNDSLVFYYNGPFSQFASWLKNRLVNSYPFFDETHYDGNIDIKMLTKSFGPFNLEEFRKNLQAYDLDVIEQEREIDVLIIKERNDR